MKQGKFALMLALLLAVTAGSAWAQRGGHGFHGHGHGHGHARVGVFIGVPLATAPFFYGPRYYYPPAYYTYPPAYYPYPASMLDTPPAYIEQAPQASAQLAPGYWYYCTDPAGYYPSVQTCAGGWQQDRSFFPLIEGAGSC